MVQTLFKILFIFGLCIAGARELEQRRLETVFHGKEKYLAIQAEIDAESKQSKTATKMGGVIQ